MHHFEYDVTDGRDGDDFDVEAAFADHGIAYWVPQGHRLVPASPQQIEAFEGDLRVRREAWYIRQAQAERTQAGSPRERSGLAGLVTRARGVGMMARWALRRIAAFDVWLEHGVPGGGQSSLRNETERTAREN